MARLAWLMIFSVFMLVFPSLASAGLTEISTDISLADDRGADWIVVFRYNESVSRGDYFILSRIENVRVLADDEPVQCFVTGDIGTTILCDNIDAAKITYMFHTTNSASALRNLFVFGQRFSVTQLTGRFSVVVRLPLGTALVEKSRLEGTGLSRFEPSWGREGTDGRRIFVEWIASEPKLGETYAISLVYEQVIIGEIPVVPILLILAGIAAVIYFTFLRKPNMKDLLPVLTENERKVMEILLKENKVDQRKLVKDLDFSKPKVSRIIKDLSDRGLVEKTRKGRTNIITLKRAKKREETAKSSKPATPQ